MKKVSCPMCGSMGYIIEPVLDDGSGPREECAYCRGTGEMVKNKLYYQCLGWLSAEKKKARRRKKWSK